MWAPALGKYIRWDVVHICWFMIFNDEYLNLFKATPIQNFPIITYWQKALAFKQGLRLFWTTKQFLKLWLHWISFDKISNHDENKLIVYVIIQTNGSISYKQNLMLYLSNHLFCLIKVCIYVVVVVYRNGNGWMSGFSVSRWWADWGNGSIFNSAWGPFTPQWDALYPHHSTTKPPNTYILKRYKRIITIKKKPQA